MTEWPDLRRHFAGVLSPLNAHAAGNVAGKDYTITVRGDAKPDVIQRAVCSMLLERKVPVARIAFNAQGRAYDGSAFLCEAGAARPLGAD